MVERGSGLPGAGRGKLARKSESIDCAAAWPGARRAMEYRRRAGPKARRYPVLVMRSLGTETAVVCYIAAAESHLIETRASAT